MLSSRQQQILQQLIETASYLPIETFTDKYQISSRTVRHDLLVIEEWLRQFDISWERSKKKGPLNFETASEKAFARTDCQEA
ncbi:HTH domain-containing protein [Paenibacillus larvae]|uniref:HTH domain-containing protein n=1 Tax=Paenibacillus larvae TaxID=1464 RepID=UPI00288FCCCC|nr:HTH domain-containing protein [Paenibacillus larvae]MDT2194195.1 HTH domain-containing protein [Paenibacillus larvae]MDT2255109.1 HTH domain-containing protein [Paenibacillus larvae]MDT2284886.1 HTH domain-containing protein [Paenibacillus larvae]MDT2293321.1 HTH domain-containing protein [Paenibacillus larvae]